ncbi:MAG: sn-glycerol-3-phosphate ABC transporter ATP-binding protein UgpC [Alphaproteobacteria bacterium]|nr:sn-glycerol-3-phosphate ABC transporter ATP-binding protein UgpC [Alphaproteobacteria bacterium]
MANVSMRQVRKSFGTTEVIHGIDIEIGDGEFAVIVGPSGCGKSTLLRMIAGLEAVTAGEVAIGDRVVNDLEPKERDVAMVFQNYGLYPHMTAFQNISYALRIARRPKAEIRERVERVARILGIEDLLARKPSQLSGGQRQRVAMGRAIIREPDVFLFDEPLSNLDAKLRSQMRVEIKRLHDELKATSIFVTHDQVEAMTMADRLVVMNQGVVEQTGTPRQVYRRPGSTYVAGFIGAPAMNLLPATLSDDGAAVEGRGMGRIALPNGAGPDGSGRRVVLGIRPEHLAVVADGSEGLLSARLLYAEDLGASRLLHCAVGDDELIVHTQDETGDRPGDTLSLAADPANLHLFDAESGRRLEAADSG